MNVLVDSTVLIDAIRGRFDRRAQLVELLRDGHVLATSAVNVAEIFAGMRDVEEKRTNELLKLMELYSITPEVARLAGTMKNRWAKKGRTLTMTDMLIAACAIEHGCLLMTDNVKDFPMETLRLLHLPPRSER